MSDANLAALSHPIHLHCITIPHVLTAGDSPSSSTLSLKVLLILGYCGHPCSMLSKLNSFPQIWHQEHECMNPICLESTVQTAECGVMVGKFFFFVAHYGFINTNQISLECYSLFVYHSISSWLQFPNIYALCWKSTYWRWGTLTDLFNRYFLNIFTFSTATF